MPGTGGFKVNVSWLGLLGGLCGFIPFFGLVCLAMFGSGESENDARVYLIVAALAAAYGLAIVVSVVRVSHRRAFLVLIAALTVVMAGSYYGDSEFLVVALPAGALLLLAALTTS
ncbi:MAG TPA: hypothetical protein VFP63_09395 [Dehalococcoidia bacterium]|nr:hypothetical protein [Dehalococcoidia bacterium]